MTDKKEITLNEISKMLHKFKILNTENKKLLKGFKDKHEINKEMIKQINDDIDKKGWSEHISINLLRYNTQDSKFVGSYKSDNTNSENVQKCKYQYSLEIHDLKISIDKHQQRMQSFPEIMAITFTNVTFIVKEKESMLDLKNTSYYMLNMNNCEIEGTDDSKIMRIEIPFLYNSNADWIYKKEIEHGGPELDKKDLQGINFIDLDSSDCDLRLRYFHHYKNIRESYYGKFSAQNNSRFKKLNISFISGGRDHDRYGHKEKEDISFFMEFIRSEIKELNINIPALMADGKAKAKFLGNNEINIIRFPKELPDVLDWGLKEKIGDLLSVTGKPMADILGRENENLSSGRAQRKKRNKIVDNKQTLIRLRQLAIDKGDKLQENTINYHITKCNEQLISLEPEGEAIQEKIIFWFGKILSDHGRSWVRPIFIFSWTLYIILMIFGCLLADAVDPNFVPSSYPGILVVQLLNPLSNPMLSDVLELKGIDDAPVVPMGILMLINKLIYAFCAYEFIRAARRYNNDK